MAILPSTNTDGKLDIIDIHKSLMHVLRQLCQIRRSVPQPTFQSLVVTLVNTRLNYGNGVTEICLPRKNPPPAEK